MMPMPEDIRARMALSPDALRQTQQAHSTAVADFLKPDRPFPNVVGVAVGKKWTRGQPTDEAAVLVLVTQKMPENLLRKEERIPSEIEKAKTDVLAVGHLTAEVTMGPTMRRIPEFQSEITYTPPMVDGYQRVMERAPERVTVEMPSRVAPRIEVLTTRVRPAMGGYSVGHINITAGTIGTCVYDLLPGAAINPPVAGIGIPPTFYILSNNHVLANSNAGLPGDPILQPGPYDGGTDPTDRIARLSRFVPITFYPQVPLALHRNLVDCAVAEAEFQDITREVFWTGSVRGWRKRDEVVKMMGAPVKKTGRTTSLTFGHIIGVNATVEVNYSNGRMARFMDQMLSTPMSAGGDSGSLLVSEDNVALGLLFAGSPQVTIFNQIENVRAQLRVEVAEQIL